MVTRIKQLLAPPTFADAEQTRIAEPLHAVLLAIFGTTLAVIAWQVITYGRPDAFDKWFTLQPNIICDTTEHRIQNLRHNIVDI